MKRSKRSRSVRRRNRRARRRTQAPRRIRSSLGALTSSALALPGLAGNAVADSPAERIRIDYGFSFYAEDDLDDSKLAAGDKGRYEIEMHQLHIESPLTERIDVGVDLVYETMSGATPWYVVPDADGDPIQVMTGATVEDTRTDALVTTSYFFGNGTAQLGGGVSVENDYLAFNGSLGGELHFNEKNTTLSARAGLSIDQIEPTDSDLYPERPDKEDKQSYSISTGIAQVLGEGSLVQSNVSFKHSRGFLSDPYKRVLVAGAPVADSRPDQRNQFAWLTQLRHHFAPIDGTLHADYRLYADDWEVISHTFELAWYQTLWERLRLIPSARYYSQSSAKFYAPFFVLPTGGEHSSDYRLSPYGALALRFRAEVPLTLWNVDLLASAGYERYMSSGDFALGDVSVENPGLVSFNLLSVGLSTRF